MVPVIVVVAIVAILIIAWLVLALVEAKKNKVSFGQELSALDKAAIADIKADVAVIKSQVETLAHVVPTNNAPSPGK